MKHAALSIDGIRAAVRRLPNNGLSASREAALAHLDEHGLPTQRDEDWKYTDLSAAVAISNRWLESGADYAPSQSIDDAVATITDAIDATWLVVANGVVSEQHAVAGNAGALDVQRFSDSPSPFVMEGPLADLNAALLQDGLRVRITGTPEKPLGVLVIDHADNDAGVSQSCVHIETAAGSSLQVIEYHVSTGEQDHYANSVLSLSIGAGASVRHVRIQNRGIHHVQTGRTSVALGRDSTLRMASYDLGGGLIRNDIDINLGEPGADVVFDGLYLAGDGQHIDNHTRVDHRVGPATSSQEYRGILQSNHNLLLSEQAEIDAKPELEIYADDVKCSHGTTVGQLDETALFYLRTRGLDKRHATQVLTHAFAADLVSRAPVHAAQDTISELVESRLAELIQADLLS